VLQHSLPPAVTADEDALLVALNRFAAAVERCICIAVELPTRCQVAYSADSASLLLLQMDGEMPRPRLPPSDLGWVVQGCV
jgi:hypothetical protein